MLTDPCESAIESAPTPSGIRNPTPERQSLAGLLFSPLTSAVSAGIAPHISPAKRQIIINIYSPNIL